MLIVVHKSKATATNIHHKKSLVVCSFPYSQVSITVSLGATSRKNEFTDNVQSTANKVL